MHDVKTRFPVYSCLLSVVTPSYSCVLRCIIHETFACDNTPRWRTEFIRFRHPVRCFGDVSKFTEWNQHHLSSQQSQRKVRKRKDCVYYFLPIWLADYLLYEFQLIFVSMEEKKSNSIWKMEYTTSAKANYSFLRMNRKICINMRNTFFFFVWNPPSEFNKRLQKKVATESNAALMIHELSILFHCAELCVTTTKKNAVAANSQRDLLTAAKKPVPNCPILFFERIFSP